MNENAMNNFSETNWERVDALTEEDIDTSDIPPLTEEFFQSSRWWTPVDRLQVLVQVVKAQGNDDEKMVLSWLRRD